MKEGFVCSEFLCCAFVFIVKHSKLDLEGEGTIDSYKGQQCVTFYRT